MIGLTYGGTKIEQIADLTKQKGILSAVIAHTLLTCVKNKDKNDKKNPISDTTLKKTMYLCIIKRLINCLG